MENIYITEEFAKAIEINPHLQTQKVRDYIEKGIKFYKKQFIHKLKINERATYLAILANIDQLLNKMPLKDKLNISCKRGCNFCCHINVTISPEEAKIIIAHCKKNNIPISQDYLNEQLKIPLDEYPLSITHSACVFIKNGECSIYPVRPIACRKYFAFTPAERCDHKKYNKGEYKVLNYLDIDLEILLSGLATLMQERQIKPDRMQKLLLKYAK